MNIYDQIIASAYYVFGEGLTSRIIASFLLYSTKNGNHFETEELKLNKLKGMFKFNNHMFSLIDGYTISDIADCIDFDKVLFFQNLKKSRDKFYNNYQEKQKVIKKIKMINGE